MVSMTATAHGPMTRAELDALPDDGRRHELIDGVLVVTPAPSVRHQVVAGNLSDRLRAGCPPGVAALQAPLDVVLGDDTQVQPDILVALVSDFTEKNLANVPLLAVEVLSPSTRLVDLNLKKARYEAAGCPSYWVFDPDRVELTVWDLTVDGYGEPTVVAGDEVFRAQRPFAVEIVPSRMLEF